MSAMTPASPRARATDGSRLQGRVRCSASRPMATTKATARSAATEKCTALMSSSTARLVRWVHGSQAPTTKWPGLNHRMPPQDSTVAASATTAMSQTARRRHARATEAPATRSTPYPTNWTWGPWSARPKRTVAVGPALHSSQACATMKRWRPDHTGPVMCSGPASAYHTGPRRTSVATSAATPSERKT